MRAGDEPRMPNPNFITIKVCGIEELDSPRRLNVVGASASLRFYGHRESDAALRLVVFELGMHDAAEMMRESELIGDFLDVEIDDRRWAYVGACGPNEARFRKEPNGPTT